MGCCVVPRWHGRRPRGGQTCACVRERERESERESVRESVCERERPSARSTRQQPHVTTEECHDDVPPARSIARADHADGTDTGTDTGMTLQQCTSHRRSCVYEFLSLRVRAERSRDDGEDTNDRGNLRTINSYLAVYIHPDVYHHLVCASVGRVVSHSLEFRSIRSSETLRCPVRVCH